MTYPDLVNRLDHDSWSLVQIDITYSSRAKDNHEAKTFINALGNVAFGQTKSRTGYDGTAYFGKKNSRLKKIKVYSKAPEVLETMKANSCRVDGDLINLVYTPELLHYSQGLIRWEASLYHRYFERLGVPTNLKQIFFTNALSLAQLRNYWLLAISDLFNALKGQTMKIIDDTEIRDLLRLKFSKIGKTGKVSTVLADSAFRTYRDIRRDGWLITSESIVRATFHRHIKLLTECGLSRAALQNMNGLNDGAQIIPFVRFIQVDFEAQFPAGYIQPAPKHVYTANPLRLVA